MFAYKGRSDGANTRPYLNFGELGVLQIKGARARPTLGASCRKYPQNAKAAMAETRDANRPKKEMGNDEQEGGHEQMGPSKKAKRGC